MNIFCRYLYNFIHIDIKSIKTRLIILISSLMVLIIGAIVIFITVQNYYHLKKRVQSDLYNISHIIGYNTAASLVFNDKESATMLLKSVSTQEYVNHALLFDANKKIIATYPNNIDRHNLKNYKLIETALNNIKSKFIVEFITNTSIIKSVIFDDELIGYLYIEAKPDILEKYKAKLLDYDLYIILLTFVLGIIIASLVSKYICTPILKLCQNMKKINANHDYSYRSNIESNSYSELATLNNIFNKMLDEIEIRDIKVKKANKLLKKDVKDKERKLIDSYEQLEYAAYHDALTDLPNIRLIKKCLNELIDAHKKEHKKMAVLFIDIDDFKKINDQYGHDVGDMLLKEIARRFNNILRESDCLLKQNNTNKIKSIARQGGDEFIIVLSDIKTKNDIESVCKRLHNDINNINYIDKKRINVTISIGVSIYPDHGMGNTDLLKNSDTAMYHAKTLGKNRSVFYNNEISKTIQKRLKIESDLFDTINNKDNYEFIVFYQPIVDMKTHKFVRLEALIRWRINNKILSPDVFIPIAETGHLIYKISDIVLHKVCQQLIKWKKQNLKINSIAINISPNLFEHTNFVDTLTSTIKKYDLEFSMFNIEVTETILMSNIEQAVEKLKELSSLGFKISIDDFGTGYSSFKYLISFPVDYIKIDKSFVINMFDNENNQRIVNSIINLAHSMGIKVIAEGVEQNKHIEYLSQVDCDYAQGFAYSKPVDASEINLLFDNKDRNNIFNAK